MKFNNMDEKSHRDSTLRRDRDNSLTSVPAKILAVIGTAHRSENL